MPLPTPRGPLSEALLADLTTDSLRSSTLALADQAAAGPVPLADDDLQVALYTCYELHYQGFAEVDDRWEWDPQLLGLRAVLERAFEAALHEASDPWVRSYAAGDESVDRQLAAMVAADDGPSLSDHMAKRADETQWAEFLTLRSVYHLKEADPHTWAIPRLVGRTKAAMVEIQADEYGGGSAVRMHSALFARVMRVFGLDDTHGAHVDAAPAEVLATLNAMSFFGPAPPAPGCGRRSPGAARDDLDSPQPPLRLGPAPAGQGRGRHPVLRRARRGRRGARAGRLGRHVRLDGRRRPGDAGRDPVRGRRGAGAGVPRRRRALQEWAAGRSALRPVPQSASTSSSSAASR